MSQIAGPYAQTLLNPIAGGSYGINPATGLVTASSLLQVVAMRRGQPQGPTNDHEVEEFIYDALDLLPGAADVEVRCESGCATLTGTVPHKRAKHDVGEIAWAISGLQDLQNNLAIASRRRGRVAGREADAPPPPSAVARKQG
jgi:osmotically-inducible protein OsmY